MSHVSIRRIQKEYKMLQDDPTLLPNALVVPNPDNLFEWHYSIFGLEEPFHGVYHGVVILPPNYPKSPPEIRMYTPNGRFMINKPLCLSISNYHPESWNPAWKFYQAILGLISVMTEDVEYGIGMMVDSKEERTKKAEASIDFNLKRAQFKNLFRPYFSKLGINDNLAQDSQEEEKDFEYKDIQGQIDKINQRRKLKEDTVSYFLPISLVVVAAGLLGFVIYKHTK